MSRIPPGSRPERLEPGQVRWRRYPNEQGGSASVHPSETARYLELGITFADGRHGRVEYIEEEAYVDVLHFYFVGAKRLAAVA